MEKFDGFWGRVQQTCNSCMHQAWPSGGGVPIQCMGAKKDNCMHGDGFNGLPPGSTTAWKGGELALVHGGKTMHIPCKHKPYTWGAQ